MGTSTCTAQIGHILLKVSATFWTLQVQLGSAPHLSTAPVATAAAKRRRCSLSLTRQEQSCLHKTRPTCRHYQRSHQQVTCLCCHCRCLAKPRDLQRCQKRVKPQTVWPVSDLAGSLPIQVAFGGQRVCQYQARHMGACFRVTHTGCTSPAPHRVVPQQTTTPDT